MCYTFKSAQAQTLSFHCLNCVFVCVTAYVVCDNLIILLSNPCVPVFQHDSDPSVIVINEPEFLADLISERLHNFETLDSSKTDQQQYQCRKFFKKMRMEANERLLSDSDSSLMSISDKDSDSEGCYHVLREARKLRKKLMRKRRGQ